MTNLKLTFCLLAILLICSCSNDLEEVEKLKVDTTGNVEVGYNVELIYNEDLELRARLLTPTMITYVDKQNSVELPEGLEILVYDKQEVVENHIWADYGFVIRDERKILLKENVRLENSAGEQMETEEITWDRQNKILFTDPNTFVTYYTGEEVIEGYGMIADEDFTNVEVTNVTGILQVNDDLEMGR